MANNDDPCAWRRLRDLFEQAMSHEGPGRDAFVARVCAGDSELKAALDALLANDHEAGAFMDEPLVQPATLRSVEPSLASDSTATSAAQPRVPERFGPYRVLRPLEQGGMSTVYLAVRDDDTFKRQVVVKLVRADLHDADFARRLRMERTILGGLDHSNIARLFDGGTAPDGRPYFVMEYVEGLPITAFADQHELTLDERLTLFRKVLAAVQYAHSNLIVHRDLKPSNILVAADGEPKLLDFGIAKLLNPALTAHDGHATATWLRLMTPHYASPEQVRGTLVGMTSDIYSLGVLLFELLTGNLPFDFGHASPGDIERIITEHDPPAPSARVGREDDATAADVARRRGLDAQVLPRRLAGDLDAMVLKALRSAPQRRYASADRFAEDIHRFQNDLPVRARQGSWRYRIAKLILRRRTATAVALTLALTLLAGIGVFTAQHAQVLRERDAAEYERGQRETVLGLLLDVLRVADPHVSAGETYSVREALESSEQALRRRLANRPALRAELLHTTGTIYHNLGLWPRARVDLEEALSLRRGLFGDAHSSVAHTRGRLALVLANLGEIDEALRLSALAMAGIEPAPLDGAGADRQVAEALGLINDRVTVLCAAHDYLAADEPSRRALALARRAENQEGLATALTNRAIVQLNHGRVATAAELLQQSCDLLRLEWGDGHPRLVYPLSNLGSARRRAGDLDAAQVAFEATLAIQRATLGDAHPTLARTLNNLAGVASARGEHGRAADLFSEALGVFVAQAGTDHPRILDLETKIARERIGAGDAARAERSLRESLARWRNRLGEEDRFLLLAEIALGQALVATGAHDEADRVLTSVFDRALESQQAEDDAATVLDHLRALHHAMGTPERTATFSERLAARSRR